MSHDYGDTFNPGAGVPNVGNKDLAIELDEKEVDDAGVDLLVKKILRSATEIGKLNNVHHSKKDSLPEILRA